MRRSEQIDQIATALSAAQGEMDDATKSASNPFYKSKYAPLDSIRAASRNALAKYKLCISQGVEMDGEDVHVTTLLVHTSGQYFETDLAMRPEKLTPQELGKVITYGRRYSWSAILGMAAGEDDDGNAGTGKPDNEKTGKLKPTNKKPPKQEQSEIPMKPDPKHRSPQKNDSRPVKCGKYYWLCRDGIDAMLNEGIISQAQHSGKTKALNMLVKNLDALRKMYTDVKADYNLGLAALADHAHQPADGNMDAPDEAPTPEPGLDPEPEKTDPNEQEMF